MAFDYSNCRNTVNFSDIITFTRATEKTAFDRFGNLTTFASGVPAVPVYDPATGQPLGLSVHEQRTNRWSYSSDLTNALFVKKMLTVEASAEPSIINGVSVQKIIPSTDNNTHYYARDGISSEGEVTVSVIAKAGEYSRIYIAQISNSAGVVFDLSSGTVVSGTGGRIKPLGSGWYLCEYTRDFNSAAYIGVTTSGITTTFAGNGTDGVYILHNQAEVGSFASSPIITEAAAATRNADVPVINNIDTLPWWNPQQGRFVMEFDVGSIGKNTGLFVLRDASQANRLDFAITSNGRLYYASRISGSTAFFGNVGSAITETTNTLEVIINGDNLIVNLNGAEVINNNYVPQVSLFTELQLGFVNVISAYLNGTAKSFIYYPNAGA